MLILFPFLAIAQDSDSEKYCFPSELQRNKATQQFTAIQVPSDTVTPADNCLIISMRPHRRELIHKFFKSSFPEASVTFSSVDIRREPCLLKIERVKKKVHETNSGTINENSFEVNAEKIQEEKAEVIQIETLKDFAFGADQTEAKGSCRFINKDRYEITIHVEQTARPYFPTAVPPGTIVVMNQPPKDQETMKLTTQVQLMRGERVELGSIVRDLKNKQNKIDIKSGLKVEDSTGTAAEMYYLSFQ